MNETTNISALRAFGFEISVNGNQTRISSTVPFFYGDDFIDNLMDGFYTITVASGSGIRLAKGVSI